MHTKRTTKRGRRKKETHQDELKKYGDWRTALYMYVGTLCFHFNFILFYGMSPYGTSPSTNALVSYNIPSKLLLIEFMKLILSVSVVSRTAS